VLTSQRGVLLEKKITAGLGERTLPRRPKEEETERLSTS